MVRGALGTWTGEELRHNSAKGPVSHTGGRVVERSEEVGGDNTAYGWERGWDYFAGARRIFFLVVDDLGLESLDNTASRPVVKLVCDEFSSSSRDDDGGRTVGFDEEKRGVGLFRWFLGRRRHGSRGE
ncbi:uncharacterized protein F4807DRAFT_472173 [Annulohypoxylon truncatum]|uniref:uncharacterized protein n=1 Tax=Annulohypoxylon truncatum TaxID=327061 RepID=UPI002007A9EF|nr:uncharacterized protein F4807DRAFT_472173 [Annulohypoxylon truncatum]KAI1212640.1 hypothetical protein F4807DRAFT_472173 [Annulohypoxylon truncatum]